MIFNCEIKFPKISRGKSRISSKGNFSHAVISGQATFLLIQ